ncbi:hypothetical protein AOQ84DRAFT_357909 [Glonium stellatum]|uniref:Uncharacterized protein n=1 Tax=Glonium stellatum TaxID=574774 RepID=A0A8E2JLC0_9PEZI|nr:hypothetical protein AOQ84DRAFT_357909 [Glonium stellatum]
MSANRASSGGVRNLRAMFENQKAPSSPEPRGRSPVDSATNTQENRPTSKVRASFVPVEPTAFVGTTKGTSDGLNSPTANRRESFSISQEHGADLIEELKKTVTQEKKDRKKSLDVEEAVPEQAVEERESSIAAPEIRNQETSDTMVNLGSIMKGSAFPEPGSPLEKKAKVEEPVAKPEDTPATPVKEVEEKPASPPKDAPSETPDKPVSSVEDTEASSNTSNPKDEAVVPGGEELPPPVEALPSPAKNEEKQTEASAKVPAEAPAKASKSTTEKSKASATASQPKAKVNGTTSHAPASKTAAKPSSHKPPAISTAKENTTKPSSSKSAAIPKSPALPKTPRTPTAPSVTSPNKSPVSKLSLGQAKDQPKAPAAKANKSSLKPSTASVATSATTKPKAQPKPAAPATTKETAKETTKDTAKDTSKDTANTSPFRKPRPKSPTRPVRLPSHLTAPTASFAAKREDVVTPQPLVRRPSTAARERPPVPKPTAPTRKPAGRPSLGPQPPKRPESRQSVKGPDESFLARMTRPTASSASKTHEKVNSPPRRTASLRSKTGPGESAVAKGKRKVGEAITKAKEKISSNGTSEGSHHEEESGPGEPVAESSITTASEEGGEVAHEPVPVETAETGELVQTPNFEGETIR